MRFAVDQFRIWYDHPGIWVNDFTDPKSTAGRPSSYHTTSGAPLKDIAPLQDRRGLLFGIMAVLAAVVAVVVHVRSWRKVAA